MTLFIVGGPCGTGKSTVAAALAKHLHCPFVEGDDLHPQANVDKMARGEPLNDDDRWGWLQDIAKHGEAEIKEKGHKDAVITCSILKKKYRDLVRETLDKDIRMVVVFLYGSQEEITKRVTGRKGHFMKSGMVQSQFEAMEVPEENELKQQNGECFPIYTDNMDPDQVSEKVLADVS
ncbi:putative gluconokinase [Yarrowia sp. B02]|nr:putative gluconokinase [Yarrowia sp. B02]